MGLKKIISIVLMIVLVSSILGFLPTSAKNYTVKDIQSTDNDVVQWVVNQGYMSLTLGKFLPSKYVKRNEFAAIVTKLMGSGTKLQNPKKPTFQDVTTKDQFYKQIETAKSFITSFKVKTSKLFKPNSYLTREDAMYSIVKVLGYDTDEAMGSNENMDLSIDDVIEDAGRIAPALVKHVSVGISNELMDLRTVDDKIYFDPKKNISRIDLAYLIYNAYQKKDYSIEEGVDDDYSSESTLNPNQVIKISDAILEIAIRAEIPKANGDLTVSDVSKITRLVVEGKNMKNLEGIQYLVNLKVLGLYNNSITDISMLSGLRNLENLVLCSNRIEDITPLKNLTNLTWLSLQDNFISDVSSLSNLTNLTTLDIQENQVRDISALKHLTKLNWLYLGSNPIKDYSPTAAYYSNLKNKDFNYDGSAYERVSIIHSSTPDQETHALSKVVTVVYPSISVKNEYKINDGEWVIYTGPITLTRPAYVSTRATDKDGNVYSGGIEVRNIP